MLFSEDQIQNSEFRMMVCLEIVCKQAFIRKMLIENTLIEHDADGTAYRLECRVECIDDIAEAVPFYINRSE